MASPGGRIVLASRSPRRRELLRHVVRPDRIEVRPPRSADEPGFEDLQVLEAIEARLREIARHKCDDVLLRQRARTDDMPADSAVVAADTAIIVEDEGRPLVLGKPPDDETWPDVVRRWFNRYYFGRTHTAATALCVGTPAGHCAERLVTSAVTFDPAVRNRLEWYIATGEPRGKAGGYALQGAGGIFLARLEGSISNVVGLPLRALLEAFDELGIETG